MTKLTRRAALAAFAGAAVAFAGAGTAQAQAWPAAQPIKMIVPFAPGGGADALARMLGEKLKDRLNQQVLIENRPGAGTVVGTEAAAKAAPDGYTLLLNVPTIITTPVMMEKAPFDPFTDFIPVLEVIQAQLYLAVSTARSKATTFQEFLAEAKAQSGEVFYGSVGSGSFGHLMGFKLAEEQGVKLQHVAYRGGAPALTALIAGEIPMTITEFGTLKPHLDSGKLRILAATGAARSPLTPNVPTLKEIGFPGYEAHSWAGVFVPRGTPAPVVQRLADELGAILGEADTVQKLANLGYDPGRSRLAAFGEMMKRDQQLWGGLIRKAGVKMN